MGTRAVNVGVFRVQFRGSNSNTANYYKGTCRKCGLTIAAVRLENHAEDDEWVICGGETGCGTTTRLSFVKSSAPESISVVASEVMDDA